MKEAGGRIAHHGNQPPREGKQKKKKTNLGGSSSRQLLKAEWVSAQQAHIALCSFTSAPTQAKEVTGRWMTQCAAMGQGHYPLRLGKAHLKKQAKQPR